MPKVSVVLFQEEDGTVPFLEWFGNLPDSVKDQCRARLELLRAHGHDLRRPAVENLGDGIYEIRAKSRGVNYRILFFFHGRGVVVLSHGFEKQRARVPAREIERAKARMRAFEMAPDAHRYME